jgi:hypothetical protein
LSSHLSDETPGLKVLSLVYGGALFKATPSIEAGAETDAMMNQSRASSYHSEQEDGVDVGDFLVSINGVRLKGFSSGNVNTLLASQKASGTRELLIAVAKPTDSIRTDDSGLSTVI